MINGGFVGALGMLRHILMDDEDFAKNFEAEVLDIEGVESQVESFAVIYPTCIAAFKV